jgi:hypothetical protein
MEQPGALGEVSFEPGRKTSSALDVEVEGVAHKEQGVEALVDVVGKSPRLPSCLAHGPALSPLAGEAQPAGPQADVAVAEPAAPTWWDTMVPVPGWT